MQLPSPALRLPRASALPSGLGVAAAALGTMAIFNNLHARAAEAASPPLGRFVEADGVRLHYLQSGKGQPLVLIHGNGSMLEDFACSLVEPASRRYRVTAFDRPGFGHSERPKDRIWTPIRQAKLLRHALRQLGIERPIVLGHSFGALVAMAYALSYPREIAGVVLESGYFFPTPRAEVPFFAMPAVPVLGALHRHTVGPLVSRLARGPLLKQLFAPNPIPPAFDAAFPREMTLRPSQLRAAGEESALMREAARHMSRHYAKLAVPSFILAGESDRVVDPHAHSVRLHRMIPHSAISIVPGTGHMVHQIRPHETLAAIDAVREAASAGQAPA